MPRAWYRFLFGTLRGRLIMSVAAVHAVMMTLFIGDLTMRQQTMLLDRQVEEATALSQALATSAAGWIFADDISGLQELVEAQHRYPELLFAILTDEGRVLADTDKSRQGLYMLDLPREARQTIFSKTSALVDVATPAMIEGRHVGWARVGIGQKASGEKLAEITRSGVIYAWLAIVIGSFIAWKMGRRITRRLYAIQRTIDEVRAGNRLARSSLTGTDEAAVMAHEFNSMLDTLAERDSELRVSEEKYRGLIQIIQTAVVVHGADTRIVTSNRLAQRLLGLTEDQMMGKSALDPDWHFFREDGTVMPLDEYPVNRVLTTGQPFQDTVVGVHRPTMEEDVWVLVGANPVLDEHGEITQVVVTFVDITERKEADERLRQLNRKLGAIGDCNQVLIRAEDEQALLDDICRIIREQAAYRMAWVGYAENDDLQTVRPMAWAGVEDGYLSLANITWADTERGHGPAGTAIRTGMSVYIQDIAGNPHFVPWRESALARGYRSTIALPLKDGTNNVFGVLAVYSSEINAFTFDEIRLLEELAGDLAFGIIVLRTRLERQRAEAALRASEKKYRTLFEESFDGLFITSIGGKILDMNKKGIALFGYDNKEEILRLDLDRDVYAYPPDRKRILAMVTAQGSAEYDVAVKKKSGEQIITHCSLTAVKDETGVITTFRGIIRDITEKKQAEVALHRLNRELRAMSNCTEILMRADDEQTLLDDICRIVCDQAGYRMAWVGYAEHNDARTVRPIAWAGVEGGYLATASITWADTERGRGPTGTAIRSGETNCINDFATETQAAPWRDNALQRGYRSGIALPLKDENAKTFGVLNIYSSESNAFAQDEIRLLEELAADMAFGIVVLRARIERRRAVAALALRNKINEIFLTSPGDEMYGEVLQVILEALKSKYGIFAFMDEDGAAVAPSLTRDVWGKCQMPGKSIVFPRESWGNSMWGRAITEKRSIYANEPFQVPAGHIPINRALDVPILYQGEVIGYFLVGNKETDYDDQDKDVLEDIAHSISPILNARLQRERQEQERKRSEEEREKLQTQLLQAQKMESVGRLAGGVAHDFNNMLGVILGYTQMALMQIGESDPLRTGLQEVEKAAMRSADLARQLLAFARKQTVAPRVLDLNETVEGMLKMLRRLIGEDIDLAWLPGRGIWPIHIDPSQIDQIMANLSVNARDAIAGVGKVTIETQTVTFDTAYCASHPGFSPGDYVLLAVSDNGCGMDQETQAHIFEPFFTTKEKGKGTGLGLATIYGIVKQNEGFVNVYSERGYGTTFKIYLPRHAAKTGPTLTESPAIPAAWGYETILMVEDEEAILDMGRLMLERYGYRVLAASTPSQAIRTASEFTGPIHLLLTDVVMPEMNGKDLVKNLISFYPGLRYLFMSGYTDNVIAHHGVLDPGVNFLQKPFSVEALVSKVREVLDSPTAATNLENLM